MLRFYERTLDIALRFRFITLMVFVATVTLTGVLYVFIPKGFFPTQDTGIIIGITDAAQDISFDQMAVLQRAANKVVLANPAVSRRSSRSVGAGRRRSDGEQRPDVHHAEAVDASATGYGDPGDRADRQKMQAVGGIRLFMQPAQDVSVGARLGRTLYQYTLAGRQARTS